MAKAAAQDTAEKNPQQGKESMAHQKKPAQSQNTYIRPTRLGEGLQITAKDAADAQRIRNLLKEASSENKPEEARPPCAKGRKVKNSAPTASK